jgi:hypothetical protein
MNLLARACLLALTLATLARPARAGDGAYIRFRLDDPTNAAWYVRISAYVHVDPWSLPATVWPSGAVSAVSNRLAPGAFSPWFDLKAYAGKRLHGRHNRAGGIAEFPNLVLQFVASTQANQRVTLELATAPDPAAVVKRVAESYEGNLTGILISPNLKADAESLETAGQMSARRLAWAREASGGVRHSPSNLIIQTGLWYAQRPELNLQEAEVLRLLGFNTVGGQTPEIRERFNFKEPGHSWIHFSPDLTRAGADEQMRRLGEQLRKRAPGAPPGSPFNFSDEVTAPAIGTNAAALAHFRAWLKARGVRPRDLGADTLDGVVPIESPDALRARQALDRPAANRIFYYSSRFRQEAATERLRWLTESFHRHVGTNALTSTLPADHPYFSGTGLGMGMGPNPAWGSTPLALDWFDLGRRAAVDLAGIEDWMGLQYMYGPSYTWEGFQLMGFQAAIFRSASRGAVPIIAWVTPSDCTNLTLKAASALCQGAKHLFFWTYGPTAYGTENYWSDLRSAYDGMARLSRQRAFAERILAPGKPRATRAALLYGISSDLWQPFGYVPMLERRLLYLALTHAQIGVDLLTEEDVLAGRLRDYAILYTADPCLRQDAMNAIRGWVRRGGFLVGTCAAGSRNEFNEPVPGLGPLFGLSTVREPVVQSGPFHLRGGLNAIGDLDRFSVQGPGGLAANLGAIGVRVPVAPEYRARIVSAFTNGEPAVAAMDYWRGGTLYIATCPGIAYGKAAGFVPRELKEKWPAAHRNFLVAPALARGVLPVVELSEPVVEAGVYDAPEGSALVLANFTYEPVTNLAVKIRLPFKLGRVVSAETGERPFTCEKDGREWICAFAMPLGLDDIVLCEP